MPSRTPQHPVAAHTEPGRATAESGVFPMPQAGSNADDAPMHASQFHHTDPRLADIARIEPGTLTRSRRSPRRGARGIVVSAAVGTLVFAACGGDEGSSGPVDLADSSPSAAVCNGTPSDVNPPASDPFSGYAYLNDGSGWTVGWDAFGDQRAIVGDDATAILCIEVTESTPGERCEYEDDGDTFTLVMTSASYSIELRNADTANVIARDTFSVDAEECPFVTSWSEGESERNSYPTPSDEQIQTSIGPFLG